jgi:hypothetical protein
MFSYIAFFTEPVKILTQFVTTVTIWTGDMDNLSMQIPVFHRFRAVNKGIFTLDDEFF